MQSTTSLTLNLQQPNCAVTMYAVQNDRLTRKIQATLFDGETAWTPPAGADGIVRFTKPDGTMGFYDVDENSQTAVTWSGNVATIMLAEQVLTVAGDVYCQINFYASGEERLSTFAFIIKVQKCAIEDNTIISSDYFNILSAQINNILAAIVHVPQISQSETWLLWDTDTSAYVDSGQPTRGATGATGAYMSGITKISGTGAGGTVDVYRVNLSNGQTAGTFNVYNGNDGEGSAGSATPLMDGTAQVGTATAYSREDHRHPTDTSRAAVTSPTFTGTPKAPTASAGTNTTQIATTAFVSTAISNLPNVSTLTYVEVTS